MTGPILQDYWTDRRKELRLLLERRAPSLAELYEGAVRILYEAIPGYTRFVCHAVREIRNRLPDVIDQAVEHGQLNYKDRMDRIAEGWKKADLAMDGSVPGEVTLDSGAPKPTDVPIPRKLYSQIGKLVGDHMQTRETRYSAAERLFRPIDPDDPRARAVRTRATVYWLDLTEWFVGFAHDRGCTDSELGKGVLEGKFLMFEYSLSAMLGPFFETAEDLDEILEEANS
jgi:hypothetical protein